MVQKSQTVIRQVDRKRALVFGLIMLLIMLIATSVSSYLSLTLQKNEEDRLASTIGTILGESVWRQFPWAGCDHAGNHVPVGAFAHATPVTTDPVEGLLNRTWRPALGEEVFIPAGALHTVRNVGGTTSRWWYGYRTQPPADAPVTVGERSG